MPLLHGGRLFLSGLQLALSPELRRYVIVPAVSGVLAFSVTLIFMVLPLAGDASTWLQHNLPTWLSWLHTALLILVYITLGLAGFWLSSLLVTLISAPLLGQLAEATWALSHAAASTPATNLLTSVRSSFGRELQKLRYHLPRFLGLLIFSLVPGLNVFMPLLWFGFGAWLMAVQFADYGSESQHQTFRFTLQRLSQARFRALGFGACVSFTLAIPFVNFLVLPAAVVGGTLLWKSITEETPS